MTGATDSFQIRPEAARSVIGNTSGLLTQGLNVVEELISLILQPTSFAQIGSSVAGQNTAMHSSQQSALQSLLQVMQTINGLVQQSVNGYDQADQAVTQGFGGTPSSTGSATSMWGSGASSQLASSVMGTAATTTGAGFSAANEVHKVIAQLVSSGVSPGLGSTPAFDNAHAFGDWLDASPANQQSAGVVGVYSGQVQSLTDVPGGMHPGDVVVVDGSGTSDIAVFGSDGQLYNNGVVTPTVTDSTVRVYRPAS